MTTDLPQRNPEGWAVVDLMGRTRLVGHVQLIQMGDVTLLEVDQPRISTADHPSYRDSEDDRVLLSAHKAVVSLANLYKLVLVPGKEHCIQAFFAHYGTYSMVECPDLWSPDRWTSDFAPDPDDDIPI